MTCEQCKYITVCMAQADCLGQIFDPSYDGEHGCTDFAPCTNADRLGAMSIEEKAQFLHSIAYNRETPWIKPFYEKFCKDCPAQEYTLDDGRKLCLHECDFKDGKCQHGTDIVWWLQQPAE